MRQSMKVLTIFVVLAGIYLLLPFTFGIYAERNTHRFVENENNALGKVLDIHLSLTHYHRGWFHSTALIQIERKNADGNMEILRSIPVEIQHGPSYFLNKHFRTGLGMVSGKNIPLNDHLPYDLTFHENIGFDGEHGAVMIFTKSDASAQNPSLKLLTIHMQSNLAATKYAFQLIGDDLAYKNPNQSLSFNIQKLQSALQANYLGDRHWDLTFGIGLHHDQLSTILTNENASHVSVKADRLDLGNLHFDTQVVAKLVSEFILLKQADDAGATAQPAQWVALFQQLLTDMIRKDTWCHVQGLKVTTPMGEFSAHYKASFPTLLRAHDYFDIATRNVGSLEVHVPNWTVVNNATHTQFEISDLQYDDNSNTVFSRHSKIALGTFDITDLNAATKTPNFYLSGLAYQSDLQGDTRSLSQSMQWSLAKLCFTKDCARKIQGQLQLSHMNFDAFRGIAKATQQLVQNDPQSSSIGARWLAVGDAYARLILPTSSITLTQDMTTPQGVVQLKGELSWPHLVEANHTVATWADCLKQSVYQLHLTFPATYVDTFVAEQQATAPAATVAATQNPNMPIAVPQPVSFQLQAAQFLQYAINQGYLKKMGTSYAMNVAGQGDVVKINDVAWKMPD